jgi:hypothetical protein
MNDWIEIEKLTPTNYGIYQVKNDLRTSIAKWDDLQEVWLEIISKREILSSDSWTHYKPLFTIDDL